MMKTISVAYRIADLDRSKAFYRAVGYLEVGTVPLDDGTSLVMLRLPGDPAVTLELGGELHPGGPDGPKTAWLVDPDGYRIELVEWPTGHADGITEADFA